MFLVLQSDRVSGGNVDTTTWVVALSCTGGLSFVVILMLAYISYNKHKKKLQKRKRSAISIAQLSSERRGCQNQETEINIASATVKYSTYEEIVDSVPDVEQFDYDKGYYCAKPNMYVVDMQPHEEIEYEKCVGSELSQLTYGRGSATGANMCDDSNVTYDRGSVAGVSNCDDDDIYEDMDINTMGADNETSLDSQAYESVDK